MLLLRIAAAPARTSPVFHTDEVPLPVALDSDEQPFAVSYFAPVFAQPGNYQDEVATIIATIIDEDYSFIQLSWQAALYAPPFRADDEIGQPIILDEDFPPALYVASLPWKGTPQPFIDTDEVHFSPLTVAEDDIGWTQVPWGALTFKQPATDTDEVSVSKILEDEPPWVSTKWSAALYGQPALDTDELFSSIVVAVPGVLGLGLLAAQAAISAAGLTPITGAYVYSTLYPLNVVAAQSPAGGAFVLPGSNVIINLSLGAGPPAPVGYAMVPNVLGMFYYDAQLAILEAGFRIAPPNFVAPVASPTAPFPQYVVAQSIPGGAFIAVQTQITITVPGFTTLLVTNTPDAHL